MPQVLEGQEDACEEFRAGLILLNMDLPEFSEISGVRLDSLKNFYKGASKPSDLALALLRLMVAYNIDPKVAGAINGPHGVDLREIAKTRMSREKYDRTIPLPARDVG